MGIDLYIENLMPKLTQKTCQLIQNREAKLNSIQWHIGESNVDKEFSEFAKICCEDAFSDCNIRSKLKIQIEIPDLLLTFLEGDTKVFRKIELKSTKSRDRSVPGSTILNLDPNIWTIFCLRTTSGFELKYGRYHLGIEKGTHDLLQDRSPRPRLIFDNFQDPNEEPNKIKKSNDKFFYKHYAATAIERILNPKGRKSWQDDLIEEIVREVKRNPNRFKDI